MRGSELPPSWRWTTLDEVCEINPRRPSEGARATGTNVTFIPMAAVSEEAGAITHATVRPYKDVSRGYTYMQDGDVIFAKITPCMQNGKHAIVRDTLNGLAFGSTEFHVLRPSDILDARLLHAFLRRKEFLQDAERHFKGTAGQQRVPADFLASVPFPLPPVREQHRLVARLHQQAAALNRARDSARSKLVKIAALQTALLARTLPRSSSEPLPDGWHWARLGEVCDVQKGRTAKRGWYSDRGAWLVRYRDLVGGGVRWSPGRNTFVDVMHEGKLQRLSPSTVLVGADAHDPATIGRKVALVKRIPRRISRAYYAGEMLGIRPTRGRAVEPEIVCHWLTSPGGYREIQENVSGGHLNVGPARNIRLPIPPRGEQGRLIADLAQQFSAVEVARRAAQAQLTAIGTLSEATLRDAFQP